MANTFDGRLIVDARWNFQRPLDLSTPKDEDSVKSETRLNSTENLSSSIYEVEELFHDQRSVTSTSTVDDITLTGGDILNSYSEDIEFVTVKAMVLVNLSTTSGDNLLVGGAGSGNDAWAFPFNGNQDARNVVGPGSPLVWSNLIDGYTVQASSQDVLRVQYFGVSSSISYDLILFGTK